MYSVLGWTPTPSTQRSASISVPSENTILVSGPPAFDEPTNCAGVTPILNSTLPLDWWNFISHSPTYQGNTMLTEGYDVTTFEFPSQKKEGKGGWEPSFASNLILNFRVLIQPYSSRLVNNFCWGGWALLSVSKLERQRTSGPQKRTKSDFMYCSQHLGASSRNPLRNPRCFGEH